MKKGMSILLTFVLVMSFAFSFSVPVVATSLGWSHYRDHSSGTLSLSGISPAYVQFYDAEQYITGSSGRYYATGSSSSAGYSDSTLFYTNTVARYAWGLYNVYPAGYYGNVGDFLCRLLNLNLSVGSLPSSSNIYEVSCFFALGSDADLVASDFPSAFLYYGSSINAPSVTFRANANVNHRLFFVCDVFYRQGNASDITFPSVTYSFDSIDFSTYGSTYSMENAINGVNSTLKNQTNSINNTITQQTQQQTNSLENGYDNSGMNNSNDQLSGSLDQYDQAESQITDQAHSYIEDISLSAPTYASGILSAISFSASFLQSLFVNMDDFNLVIVLALTLTFVSMLIGWFRFRK